MRQSVFGKAGPRSAGVLLALALDHAVADPRRGHPVAGFGTVASWVEKRQWRDDRQAGVRYVATCVGIPLVAAALVQHRVRGSATSAALFAVAAWATIGGSSLRREGRLLGTLLNEGDIEGARGRLGYLCGRDPSTLDLADLARATVESIAENTSDAVVAPLMWGGIFGLSGVVGYRAVNTLDAMVGHRSDRYRHFGWAAARLDDAVNLAPARLSAVLSCALAPLVGGDAARAFRILRRDGRKHPSPNAGRCESAFAGALDVRLGGTNVYAGEAERRGPHGDGATPTPADVERAARLSEAVGLAAAGVVGGLLLAFRRRGLVG
jgi:adenosylcobinamide-phosphate synthase